MVCKRERKNKKYEPITNPASKTSDVELNRGGNINNGH
jgi:hypothetical protein